MGNYFRKSLGKALFYSDLISFTLAINKTFRDVSCVLDDIFCDCDCDCDCHCGCRRKGKCR